MIEKGPRYCRVSPDRSRIDGIDRAALHASPQTLYNAEVSKGCRGQCWTPASIHGLGKVGLSARFSILSGDRCVRWPVAVVARRYLYRKHHPAPQPSLFTRRQSTIATLPSLLACTLAQADNVTVQLRQSRSRNHTSCLKSSSRRRPSAPLAVGRRTSCTMSARP